ncbi:hypothetical protein HMP0721_1543 [Pseudoramibacter alactolyticus ATCC 23263]|uniref:Uncharacterized protein n=1 Tax=Pseudoramibacter alactolyticus ATCC 23263 TaxID=887929 RepID=E6MHQ8_9FIRM|nr:hypothetical protein HMP0721_1543 [Pseudoramibacter alactolyticus ATCC 23263]
MTGMQTSDWPVVLIQRQNYDKKITLLDLNQRTRQQIVLR